MSEGKTSLMENLTDEQKKYMRKELDGRLKRKLVEQYSIIMDFMIKKSRDNLLYFAELSNRGWKNTRLMKYLLPEVQKFIEGTKEYKDTEILIVNVPPQSGKSMGLTETVPAWYLGRYEEKRTLLITYGDDLAQRFGRRNKQKLEEWGESVFGVTLSKSKKSHTEFELSNNIGSIASMGISGGITGKPGELIIIDDPIRNREQAESETVREKIWQEFESSIYTRLQANGKIILIQTRWHEDDLTGRIIKSDSYSYKRINIPCEAEKEDVLGRKEGEPLVPELGKDEKWLAKTKKAYLEGKNEDIKEHGSGESAWSSLYQGSPTIAGGNIFKKEWWKYYKQLPSRMDMKLMSVDCSFKDKESSDYVVIQVWGKYGTSLYLIDSLRKRLGFPETVEAIRVMKDRHRDTRYVLVEDKANGSAVISTLKNEIYGIVEIDPQGSKISRANQVTYVIETGYVYLPEYHDWVVSFRDEMEKFPRGTFDDQVDCATQALSFLIDTPVVHHNDYESDVEEGYLTPDEREDRKRKQKEMSGMGIRRSGSLTVEGAERHLSDKALARYKSIRERSILAQ